MVEEFRGINSNQNNLILLCKEYGWDPLFLENNDDNFNWDDLSRELEACCAAGKLKLCEELSKCVERIKGKPPANYSMQFERYSMPRLVKQRSNYWWFNSLLVWRHLFVRRRAGDVLRLILSKQDLEPMVFCFEQKADFAEQWGLEMNYWNSQQKHDLVIALGNSASRLGLSHPGIAQCLEESTLSVERANKLIVLKAIKQSTLRSRSDYEKSIMQAWSFDPDCDTYLDLLRKVVAFRLRHEKQNGTLMADFGREIVEYEVAKKLVRFLA